MRRPVRYDPWLIAAILLAENGSVTDSVPRQFVCNGADGSSRSCVFSHTYGEWIDKTAPLPPRVSSNVLGNRQPRMKALGRCAYTERPLSSASHRQGRTSYNPLVRHLASFCLSPYQIAPHEDAFLIWEYCIIGGSPKADSGEVGPRLTDYICYARQLLPAPVAVRRWASTVPHSL